MVLAGSGAPAFYTVTNLTMAQRNGNFVKYLPPNVTQVTAGGTFADTCGATFNLAGSGQAGSSCTLQSSWFLVLSMAMIPILITISLSVFLLAQRVLERISP